MRLLKGDWGQAFPFELPIALLTDLFGPSTDVQLEGYVMEMGLDCISYDVR